MRFGYRIEFNEHKNLVLKKSRIISFEDIVSALKSEDLVEDLKLPNKKFPNQRIFTVKIRDYVYVVPYVLDKNRKVLFLKTVYPSRKMTKKYLKEDKT